MKVKVEVCAGSVEDCVKAHSAHVDRIELNNALHLGGLTPSPATLLMAKEATDIPIVSMVRPRAGGFHYNDIEVATMFMDARILLENGSDGIAFGFLTPDGKVDESLTLKMVKLCHEFQAEAVFHRAIDVVTDADQAIESLIHCGVNRVLTSGLAAKAIDGLDVLESLQTKYGDQIEILIGSGVNESNVLEIIEHTGIHQVHGSFKGWFTDPTTQSDSVSYAYSNLGNYDGVDELVLKSFMKRVK